MASEGHTHLNEIEVEQKIGLSIIFVLNCLTKKEKYDMINLLNHPQWCQLSERH